MEAPNEDVEPGEATSAAAQQGTKAITLPQLPFIPNLPISPLVVIHVVFTGFVILYTWLPLTYLFVHLALIMILLWAAHNKESAVAVIIYLVVLAYSFVTDVIGFGYYFASNDRGLRTSDNRAIWQFSAAMTVIHFIIKPVMGLYGLVVVIARRRSLKVSLKDDSRNGYSSSEPVGGDGSQGGPS